MRWTDPSGRCIPEWFPGGEPGCTLVAGIGQGHIDTAAGQYAARMVIEPYIQTWDTVSQNLTRSPQHRLDDYLHAVQRFTPLGVLQGDPLAAISPLPGLNLRWMADQTQGTWQFLVAWGSDFACGDPYRWLRGLSTTTMFLLPSVAGRAARLMPTPLHPIGGQGGSPPLRLHLSLEEHITYVVDNVQGLTQSKPDFCSNG